MLTKWAWYSTIARVSSCAYSSTVIIIAIDGGTCMQRSAFGDGVLETTVIVQNYDDI